jgi:hypothetical protein
MTKINITQLTIGAKSKGSEVYTLESPEVSKAIGEAVAMQSEVDNKWQYGAAMLYAANVRADSLTNDEKIKAKVTKMIVSALSPLIQKALALPKVGRTADEGTMATLGKNKIGKYLGILASHLQTMEDKKDGNVKTLTMGESMAKQVQELIDKVNRASEKKLNFNAVESVDLLKKAKAVFLKNPTLKTSDIK